MTEYLKCEQDKDRNELFRFIPFAICVALVLILAYVLGLAPVNKYELCDSDCYLRLLRVENLHKGGSWCDPVILRIDPPRGQTSHWTRPFDVLLLAGALPISLFTDFESALFWWGVIISPVLLTATLIALQWSARPVLSSSADGPFLACFVFVLQMVAACYYMPGRPDHHSLLVFFFVISVGCTFRMIVRPISPRLCYIAGAISALSVWTSVECMVPVGITIGVLGLFWVLEGADFLNKSLHYILALLLVTGLGLALERRWSSLFAEEYDRLSIVHLSVFGLIAVLWITTYVLNRQTRVFRQRANRLASILIGMAVLALSILATFPRLYRGPFCDIDPRIVPMLLNNISEVQPLISQYGSLVIPVQVLGSAVICFPLLFSLLLSERRDESWKGWIFILVSSVSFILISLWQIRWSVYVGVLLSIPTARLMVFMRELGPKTGFLRVLKNVFVVVIFSSTFLVLGLLADKMFRKVGSEQSHHRVSLIGICDYLVQAKELAGQDLLILTHIDFGAEILYRTEHKVLCTPHVTGTPGRKGQGILDAYDAMTAETDEQALDIIQKRGIDLILLCPASTESIFYSKPEQKSTFYQRLRENVIPDWLRTVELPAELSSSFLLFETSIKRNQDTVIRFP